MAKNPDGGSTLPFVIDVPLPDGSVILKAKEPWPRTTKVYCHRVDEWPDGAEIVEEVAVRSCVRRGVADRPRAGPRPLRIGRSSSSRGCAAVATASSGRAPAPTRKTRPGLRLPTRRSAAGALTIIVDTRERYPWKFSDQQVTVSKGALPVGDYAVEIDGDVVAAVERKTLADLAARLVDGSLLIMLGELASLPRAAIVVEDRWADVFRIQHVSPSMVAEMLAGAQVRYPNVPIVFCETRALAQEWAYRFLGAALAFADRDTRALHATKAGTTPPTQLPRPRSLSGGGVPERPNGTVLKTVEAQVSEGSNPSPSALCQNHDVRAGLRSAQGVQSFAEGTLLFGPSFGPDAAPARWRQLPHLPHERAISRHDLFALFGTEGPG